MVQTNIFDFIESKEQKWFFGDNGYMDVNVIIPKHIKSPFEVDYLSDEDFREWTNYCLAIQAKTLGSWSEVRELFTRHRESGKPIKIRIYESHDFRPEFIE